MEALIMELSEDGHRDALEAMAGGDAGRGLRAEMPQR